MSEEPNFFGAALRRVRGRVLLPLLGGNLLLIAVGSVALLIPDSHVWQLLLSALVALAWIAGLLAWNNTALRNARNAESGTTALTPLWAGALLLGGCLLLGAMLMHMIGLLGTNVDLRAGFWNSKLSPALRHLLPYTRLIALQNGAIQATRWVLVPAVLLPLTIEIVAFGLHASTLLRGLRVLARLLHWIIALVALGVAVWLTPLLVDWHPTDTVHGEVVSAAFRLTLVALIDAAAVVALLVVDAELLHRTDLKTSKGK